MPAHTELDGGCFMEATERVKADPVKYGRRPGQILAGHNAPDALIVMDLPSDRGPWLYAEDLAADLFQVRYGLGERFPGKYLSRVYTFAKKGYLESVVLYPRMQRFYRVLDIEKCRSEVSIRFLTGKYKT